jgi:hypothetical protein
MLQNTKVGDIRIVNNIPQSYQFISDSQDVTPVLEDCRAEAEAAGLTVDEYDSVFVLTGDGEYLQVWGMVGIVPRLSTLVTRIL